MTARLATQVLFVFLHVCVFLICTGSSLDCDRRVHSGYGRHGIHEGQCSVHILSHRNYITTQKLSAVTVFSFIYFLMFCMQVMQFHTEGLMSLKSVSPKNGLPL